MARKSNTEIKTEYDMRCAVILEQINARPREEREALLLAATTYRSGNDSCNSVYMGGIAHHSLRLALRDPYPNKMSYAELIPSVSDKLLEAGIKAAIHTIEYMLRNPRWTCACCGSITDKYQKAVAWQRRFHWPSGVTPTDWGQCTENEFNAGRKDAVLGEYQYRALYEVLE